MALGDGAVWNEAEPTNATVANQIDDYNRDLRVGIRSRMAREHIWPDSQTGTGQAGHHSIVSLQTQTAAPSYDTSAAGVLYASSGGGLSYNINTGTGVARTLIPTDGVNSAYPIGSIYISVASTNPGTLFGGTWEAFGAGRVLLGNGGGYSAGDTGGAATHTLTTAEIPSHTHTLPTFRGGIGISGGAHIFPDASLGAAGGTSGATGSGGAHNNLQPYVVVYMWRRTA